MKYTVKLFASLKEQTGKSEWHLESNEALTGSALLTAFFDQYPQTSKLRGVTRLAVNQAFCADDPQLAESDELALIPPVSGG